MPQKILGISAFYHDSAAALLVDGYVIAAAQEERFTRKKHDPAFPREAIGYCLREAHITVNDLDLIVFYDKPLLKFERLLETFYASAPRGLKQFLSAMPVWIREKLFLKDLIRKGLQDINGGVFLRKDLKILFPEHHYSHAASAYYPSPFNTAAVLTVDGVGEWATTTIAHGVGKDLTILKEMRFPHSLGLLYSAFTYYTGFKVNSGEYKLMGLAPYGDPHSERTRSFIKKIKDSLIDIKLDGSFCLNMDYFDYTTGLNMTKDDRFFELFQIQRRNPESEIDQATMDLAYAIQSVTEEVMLRLANHARELTHSPNLCLAGGVALNCVANGRILSEGIFDKIWIQPAAGDAGGALGAAYLGHHVYFKYPKEATEDQMRGSYLGPHFDDHTVGSLIARHQAVAQEYQDFDRLAVDIARLLSDGQVVGWFQGRMEWGPRALGNRSILGNPKDGDLQKRLNVKIKFRESFRPFAPSVLEEDLQEFFDLKGNSPYMLLVAPVKEGRRTPLPIGFHQKSMREKLYFRRSDIPAITHLDYSARIQTVKRETNPRYWKLLKEFKSLTGIGVVVNTSFNVRGEPIVMSPEDAYRCFMRTDMDCLVINNHVFHKSKQPPWKETRQWQLEYTLD